MRVRLLASSNAGKLREYRALAAAPAEDFAEGSEENCQRPIEMELLPGFEKLAAFPEDAPTFAENAAGKALHYSRFTGEIVFADDSGLAVAALGGAPGVRSARCAEKPARRARRNSFA